MSQRDEMAPPTNDEYLTSIKRYVGDAATGMRNSCESIVAHLGVPGDVPGDDGKTQKERLQTALLKTINDNVYAESKVSVRSTQLLRKGTVLPTFTSEKDPLGLNNDNTMLNDPDRKSKAKRDKDIIQTMDSLCKQLDVAPDAPYAFLEHHDDVYTAVVERWENKNTWVMNMTKILQFYAIAGIDRQPLYASFKEGQWAAVQTETSDTPKNRTLTPDESATLRKINKDTLVPKAMELLGHEDIARHDKTKGGLTRMAHVHSGIESFFMYGSKEGHTLFRNDLVTMQFKTLKTDLGKDNYVSVDDDGGVKFHMNSFHKVNPGGKRLTLNAVAKTEVFDITDSNPLMAEFLVKYEPVCKEVHGDKKAYLLFKYQKEIDWGDAPLKPNALTLRNCRVYRLAIKDGGVLDGALDPQLAILAGTAVLPKVPGRRMVKGLLRQSTYQEYYYQSKYQEYYHSSTEGYG